MHIVLVHPQIPHNTGVIGRLCVNLGATLHLVKPLGFDISDKAVRRAGLDYWEKLDVRVWESLDAYLEAHPVGKHTFLATTKTSRPYFQAAMPKEAHLLFGSETAGLPETLLAAHSEQCVTLPMTQGGRSLNLAMSVAVVAYDVVRQNFEAFEDQIVIPFKETV